MKESDSEYDSEWKIRALRSAAAKDLVAGDLVRIYHAQVELSRDDAIALGLTLPVPNVTEERIRLKYRNDFYSCDAILLESFEDAKKKLFSIKNLEILRLDIVRVRALIVSLQHDAQTSLKFYDEPHINLSRMVVGDVWLQISRDTKELTLSRAVKISNSPI